MIIEKNIVPKELWAPVFHPEKLNKVCPVRITIPIIRFWDGMWETPTIQKIAGGLSASASVWGGGRWGDATRSGKTSGETSETYITLFWQSNFNSERAVFFSPEKETNYPLRTWVIKPLACQATGFPEAVCIMELHDTDYADLMSVAGILSARHNNSYLQAFPEETHLQIMQETTRRPVARIHAFLKKHGLLG